MRITEPQFTKMRSWERCHAASVLDDRAREIEADIKHAFVELGLLCVEMDERELFRELVDGEGKPKYQFFDHWLRDAMPTQRSTAYAAKSAMEALRGIVPASELQEMPRCNIETLGKCSSNVGRDPKMWEPAKRLTQNEFVRAVMLHHEDQLLEERDPYRLAPTKGQRETIDAAIAAVRVLQGDDNISRTECLYQICQAFIDDREELLKRTIKKIENPQPQVIQ